jgi:hypothetical protein
MVLLYNLHKKPNDNKRVHFVKHECMLDNAAHAFVVVLQIGRDITLLRLGLTVIFGLISRC